MTRLLDTLALLADTALSSRPITWALDRLDAAVCAAGNAMSGEEE
jgi:hypothetical protein